MHHSPSRLANRQRDEDETQGHQRQRYLIRQTAEVELEDNRGNENQNTDQKQFSAAPLYDNNQTAGCGLIDKELGGVDPWSEDNLAEVEKGWILKGETLEELVGKINENSKDEGYNMDPAALQSTIDAFNASCATGSDPLFGRPAVVNDIPNLTPLDTPPFYALRLMPCMNTTKGGPVKNGKAQVLDVRGEVIPRLYEAGTLGHTAAQVYCIFGANLAECFNFGRIAGRNAAAETALE
jgi:succinate dehydrogenase/fumarate reductase flavoprotein subunit